MVYSKNTRDENNTIKGSIKDRHYLLINYILSSYMIVLLYYNAFFSLNPTTRAGLISSHDTSPVFVNFFHFVIHQLLTLSISSDTHSAKSTCLRKRRIFLVRIIRIFKYIIANKNFMRIILSI